MFRFLHRACTFIVVLCFTLLCLAALSYAVAQWLYPDQFDARWVARQAEALSARKLFALALLGLWAVVVVVYGAWVRIKSVFQKRSDRKIKFREADSSIHITQQAINDFLKQRLKAIEGVDSTTSDFEQVKDGTIIVEIAARLRGVKPLPELRKDIVSAARDALENWLGIPTVQAINVVCEDIKYVSRELPPPESLLPARRDNNQPEAASAGQTKRKSWFSRDDAADTAGETAKSAAAPAASGTNTSALSDEDTIIDAVPSYEVKLEKDSPTDKPKSGAADGENKFYSEGKKFYEK